MAARIDQGLCTGCEACVEACPVDAINIQGDKAWIDADTCVDCGVCVDECPNDAISLPD